MAGALGGFFFPIITGKLPEHFAKTDQATAGYAILFGICALAYLVARPRFERVELH